MISSPGPRSRAIARVIEKTFDVVDGPTMKPFGIGVEELAHRRLDLLGEQCVARVGGRERSVAVGVVAAALPGRCRLDRGVDDLRAGRPVEAGPFRCSPSVMAGNRWTEIEHAVTLAQRRSSRRPTRARRRRPRRSRAACTMSSEKVTFGGIVSGWAYP